MIPTGVDHHCGHPMIQDTPKTPPRCAICEPSISWTAEQRRIINQLRENTRRSAA